VRRSVLAGGAVHALNPCAWSWNYPVRTNPALGSEGFVRALAAVLAEVLRTKGATLPEETAALTQGAPLDAESLERIVRDLLASPPTIVVGEAALSHAEEATILDLVSGLAEAVGARTAYIAPGANARGLHRLGLLPGGDGARAFNPWADWVRARLLFGFQPEYDLLEPGRALRALAHGASVHITTHLGPESARHASVVLPLAAFFETSGGWMSLEGRIQEIHAVVPAPGQSRPGWRILSDLGRRLGGEEAAFPTEFSALVELCSPLPPPRARAACGSRAAALGSVAHGEGFVLLRARAPYACDPLLRQSSSLQETVIGRRGAALGLNPEDARRFGIVDGSRGRIEMRDEGGRRIVAPAVADAAVPRGHVHLPVGSPELLEAGCVEGATVRLAPVVELREASAS
jgi:NADH-quinone oxidoreductase subunit G